MAIASEECVVRAVAIDDSEVFLASMRGLLAGDARVELVGHAYSARVGLDLIEFFSPDLVLIDVAMPGMNGLTATRLIRKKNIRPRVILMSTYKGAELALAAMEAGADAFVHKLDLDAQLMPLVAQWFGPTGMSTP